MGRLVVVVVVLIGFCFGQGPILPPPSPFPFPSPSPLPVRPSQLPNCVVDLIPSVGEIAPNSIEYVVRPFSTLTIIADSVCNIDPRGSTFEWSYRSETRKGVINSEGDLCFFPLASCSGSRVQIDTSFFDSNTIITINLQSTLVYFDNKLQVNSTFQFTILPQAVNLFVSGGFVDESFTELSLKAFLVNNNAVESVVYSWSCTPVAVGIIGSCPPCPRGNSGPVVYPSNTTNLIVSFLPFQLPTPVACSYRFTCTVTISALNFTEIATDSRLIISREDAFYPSLEFTDASLIGCQNLVAGTDLFIQLEPVFVPVGFEIEDYLWTDVGINCSLEEYNCGGDGFPFLYVPASSLPVCDTIQTGVTVVVGGSANMYETTRTFLSTCEYSVLGPPVGGDCYPEQTSCVLPGARFRIICRGWQPSCSTGSQIFSYSVIGISEESNNFIRFISDTPRFFFSVGSSQSVFVRVCDSFGSCSSSEAFNITICDLPSAIASDRVADLLDEAQECLLVSDLLCALDQQLAAADALPFCEDNNAIQVLRLISQSNALFERFLIATDRNTTSLPDLTTILQIWAVTALKSCDPIESLFFRLAQICQSTEYSGSIASASLDALLTPLLLSVASDANQFYDFLDFAFDVNDCYQKQVGPPNCGEQVPLVYRGDTFSYFQQVVALEDMSRGFALETEWAIFHFPPGFDRQLTQLYNDQIGGTAELICVIFNLVTAAARPDDTHLYTPLSGLTARFIQTIAGTYSISRVLDLNSLEDVVVEFFLPTNICNEHSRFDLTPEAAEDIYVPSYYTRQGIFDGNGVSTINVTCTSLFADVTHFSNLAVLYLSSGDTWNAWRITAICLMGVMWSAMIVLFLLVSCSESFRKRFRLETERELAQRVLGTQKHLAKRRVEPLV